MQTWKADYLFDIVHFILLFLYLKHLSFEAHLVIENLIYYESLCTMMVVLSFIYYYEYVPGGRKIKSLIWYFVFFLFWVACQMKSEIKRLAHEQIWNYITYAHEHYSHFFWADKRDYRQLEALKDTPNLWFLKRVCPTLNKNK